MTADQPGRPARSTPETGVSRETVARDLFGPAYPIVAEYAQILVTDGIDRGLVGPREADRIWDRHVLNSAVLARLVPSGSRVVDVGSGAGLPGIPLALARPDLEVTLLEPLLRRTRFLDEVVNRLGLTDRVTIVRGRAETQAGRLTVDAAVSRAVAPLERLVPWCLGLLRPGGVMLALKGERAEPELAAAAGSLASMGAVAWSVEVVGADLVADPARVVRVVRAEDDGRPRTARSGPRAR